MKEPKLRFKTDDGSQFPKWEEKKFYEVVKLYRGSSPRPIVNYMVDDNHGLNWIKISDIPQSGNIIATVKEHISNDGSKKSRAVYKGEIILSNSMSFGKPCILGVDGFIHDGWFVVREYEEHLNKWYLCQLLNSDIMHKQYRKLAAGGVVLNISSELVNSTKIPVPCLQEQQKIASLFTELDTLIQSAEKELEGYRELKQGMLQKMFPKKGEMFPEIRFPEFSGDWEQRKFGELYSKVSEKNDLSFGADKIISVANMYYKEEVKESSDKYMRTYNVMRLGDIAFEGNKSKNYSHGRFVENTIGDGIVSHVFDVFRPTTSYDLLFWKYLINNEGVMGRIMARCTNASTMMTNLVASDFLKEKILVPSLKEQKKIGTYFDNLDSLIALQQKEIDGYKELKKGLLQQMFC